MYVPKLVKFVHGMKIDKSRFGGGDTVDNDLLTTAANDLAKYCDQVKSCHECKVQVICDALSDTFGEAVALPERIRITAER